MLLDDYSCVFCSNYCEETSFHLFFERPLATVVGNINLSIDWNLQPPLDMVIEARNNFDSYIFRDIIIS